MQRLAGILAIGGGLILISWVTSPAALPTPSDPRVSPAELDRADQTAQTVAPLTSEINDQAARLRAHLSQPPPKPVPARNPFQFGGTSPSRKGTDPAKKGTDPAPTGYVPLAPVPLALPIVVAITSDARDGGPCAGGISMGDEMKIVTPGQVFNRFMLESIGPDRCASSISRAQRAPLSSFRFVNRLYIMWCSRTRRGSHQAGAIRCKCNIRVTMAQRAESFPQGFQQIL